MSTFDEAYFLSQLQALLAIDSTTGQFREIQRYLTAELGNLGYDYSECRKGGVIAAFGGTEEPLVVTAHLDDIGLMVRSVNADGTLQVCPVGGLYPFYCTGMNVRLATRSGKRFTGTVCRRPASVHVSEDELRKAMPDFRTNVCVVLDEPVHTAADLKGLMIRVPTNQIQTKGFEVLGATPVGMALGDVYTALQQGTIDGGENPLSTLYGRKHHEVAKYLILDGHVLNFTNWVCSADWFNSLTEEQQTALIETGKEAGIYNNEKQAEADAYYRGLMEAEGVTVYEPTEEDLNTFRERAKKFYELGADFGWSDGLFETVHAAMGK